MKLMIASDIHGAADACRALLAAFDREKAERLILLGDILYHGPRNDLPAAYDPRQAAALLNDRKESILCVRGNCDAEVDQMMLAFPVLADYAVFFSGGLTVYAAHGHACGPGHLPPLRKGDILLCGHTHVPAWEDRGDYRYFNPGSVSLPKNGSPRGYILWKADTFTWKTLDGEAYQTLTIKK